MKKNIFYIKLAHKIKALKNASNIKQLKKISFEKKITYYYLHEMKFEKKITSYFFVLLKKRVCDGAAECQGMDSDKLHSYLFTIFFLLKVNNYLKKPATTRL